jgi:PAS domain S-box-containing protein
MDNPRRSPGIAVIFVYGIIFSFLSWIVLRYGGSDNPLVILAAFSILAMLHVLGMRGQWRNLQRLDHIRRVLMGIRNVNQLIISEDDPQRLIERACENLTETLGYSSAWIALLGQDDVVTATAASGFGSRFPALQERLRTGEFPQCMREALAYADVVVTDDPQSICLTCPLEMANGGKAKLSRRLHHDGNVYGMLAVCLPSAFACDTEELALFAEVAGDLAFALHKIAVAERLRESENAYSTLFNQSVAGLYLHDREGKILDVNRLACIQSGYSRDELLQMSVLDLHPGEPPMSNLPRDEVLRAWAQWQPEQSYTFEVTHQRKDGTLYPVDISTGVIRYAGGDCIQAIVQDITQRKQAERDLLHSHNLMSYIIEHNKSAIAVHDREMNYVYVSRRYLDDYRVRERDVIGKHHYDVFPDLPQKWRDVHQRALRGEVISAEEDAFEREDGTVDWTRWECRPWHDADGTIGGIIVYTEIINERRELERFLRRQERLAAVGQLSAGISHDFRNLITTIIAYGQLGKQVPGLSPQTERHLDIIMGEARKATELIEQILDFSRRTELDRQSLDLIPLVEKVLGLLRRTLPSTIRISLEAQVDTCMIEGDAGRLQQLLTNLALNARDAMPDGGMLRVELARYEAGPGTAPPLPAMADAGAPPAWICLSVGDTGAGMSPEVLAHLFEPFFTTKDKGKGTGLGLAQVYGIVKLHAGYIDVESVPGQGTTVRIYLPEAPVRAARTLVSGVESRV